MIPSNLHDAVGFNKNVVDDLHGEGSFSVGGVKNPRFLFPAKKSVDVCQAVVEVV